MIRFLRRLFSRADPYEPNIEGEPVSWEQWRINLRQEAEDEQRRAAAITQAFDRVHSTPMSRKLRGIK